MIGLTELVKNNLSFLIANENDRSFMPHPSSEDEWQARASAYIKAKMKECGVTYAELIKRLEKYGFKETEASITMKLKRGTFAATFFLAALAAIGVHGMKLEDI